MTTSHIQPLPPEVIQAIAAGEVVERPSVIVKELVENALDAQATQVSIELKRSGLESIVVSDNGQGMDEADLLMSFQRHTTSKLRTAEDLQRIQTLGFRGEALASIAQACRLTIQTKTKDISHGCRIIVKASQLISTTPVGMPNGTMVTVDEIFHALPARRKFLKQPATELRQVIEVITALALSYPTVGFSLINDGKVLIFTSPHQTVSERIYTVFGAEVLHSLQPIEFGEQFFKVTGFIGSPQLATRTKTKQYLFVNHRSVSHPRVQHLIKEAYGSLLEPRTEPVFLLSLELPPSTIDVNIHPRKEVVNFQDEAKVLNLIQQAVQHTLHSSDLTFQYYSTSDGYARVHDSAPSISPFLAFDHTSSEETKKVLKDLVQPWQLGQTHDVTIAQLHHTYLVTETPEGLILIDQHAAHERILYEQFYAALHSEHATLATTQLDPAVHFEAAPTEEVALEQQLGVLHHLGFQIEPFGQHVFMITQVPTIVKDRNMTTLLHELLADIQAEKPIRGLDQAAHRTIAYLACRNAVKAGDFLSPDQRHELIEKLLQTPNRFTCPHGRPTMVVMKLSELEMLFRRKK